MFTGFATDTIEFMRGLRVHNNKEWFQENKVRFEEFYHTPMKALAQEVFEELRSMFPDYGLKYKVSRIYKDARRIRGGDPYRINMWFSIEKPSEDWTAAPVFWFDIGPESWSYGLGFYQAKPMTLAKLRARIDKDPTQFEKLFAAFEAQQEFELDGEEYKRKKTAPTEYAEKWYNRKSISLAHYQATGAEVFSADLKKRLLAGYQFLMPYYDYFVGLDNDPDPTE